MKTLIISDNRFFHDLIIKPFDIRLFSGLDYHESVILQKMLHQVSEHREKYPRPRRPGQTFALLKCRQLDDLFHELKTVKGCYTSFHHRLHGAVGMVSYAHAVYVICYFCHMFSLGFSSGNSDRVRMYRRVISGKQICYLMCICVITA